METGLFVIRRTDPRDYEIAVRPYDLPARNRKAKWNGLLKNNQRIGIDKYINSDIR